jgi:hypothetical protein
LHPSDKIGNLEIVKLWKYLVLAAVVVASVYVYLHWQEFAYLWPRSSASSDSNSEGNGAESSTSSATPVAHVGRFNWRRIGRPEGFAVEMPCDIRKIEVPAFSERGATDEVQMILCNPDTETTFSVSWEDNPPIARAGDRSVDRILDGAKEGALARTQSTEVSESRSSPGGLPGRDFVGRNAGGGVISARLLYVGQRLYLLSAAFPSDSARRDEDIARFFDSFSLPAPSRIPETLPTALLPTGAH